MECFNFICYRGGTLGEMLGGTLHQAVKDEDDLYGTTHFSVQKTENESFWNDLPRLLLEECKVFVIMLTKGFFDDFIDPKTKEINQRSVTRREIELALQNPDMKFLPVIFNDFTWDEKNLEILKKSVPGDIDRLTTALPIKYIEQYRNAVLDAIKDRLRTSFGGSQNQRPLEIITKPPRKKTIVVDGLPIDLISATKNRLESNYHLCLSKAYMDVYITGSTFEIVYLYEGTVLKKRRDKINGLFLNIVTPSSDANDTQYAYGYDLINDPDRTSKLQFTATESLSSMARKMYLPLRACKKGDPFRIEIRSRNTNAILPLTGMSKFLFRLPFKNGHHANGMLKDYRFTIHFSSNPSRVNCTRIIGEYKTLTEGQLVPTKSDRTGFFAYNEPFKHAPIGTIRVYTFNR